jgi:hypothetical protein
MKRSIVIAAALAVAPIFTPGASAMDILVPAYFYPAGPNNFWDDLAASAPEVGITAILNPNNGPGATQDANYVAAVDDLQAAGGTVIGYVYTQYGARDIDVVKADIDSHVSLYGVDGIFIDEMSNLAGNLAYYEELYDYIKALSADYSVIGNPGTTTLESYLSAADTLVTFENPYATYPGYTPDAWTAGYDADRFAHLVYDVDAASMQAVIDQAASQNVGYLYVTSDKGANPWDTLPPYWADEVTAVASIPEPGIWASLIAGLGVLGWKRGRSKR